jgi:hypothetical protein
MNSASGQLLRPWRKTVYDPEKKVTIVQHFVKAKLTNIKNLPTF